MNCIRYKRCNIESCYKKKKKKEKADIYVITHQSLMGRIISSGCRPWNRLNIVLAFNAFVTGVRLRSTTFCLNDREMFDEWVELEVRVRYFRVIVFYKGHEVNVDEEISARRVILGINRQTYYWYILFERRRSDSR